jgi:glycosyltransferase involved in cell wall biosynthesis
VASAHVLHVIEDCNGTDPDLTDLTGRLREYKHSVVRLGPAPTHEVPSVVFRAPRRGVSAWIRAWRLLRSLRPQIVHTHSAGAVFLQAVAALAGVRVRVHTEHAGFLDRPGGALLQTRRWRLVVQHYVAASRNIEKQLLDRIGVEPGKVSQIYDSLETDSPVTPSERSRQRDCLTVLAVEEGTQMVALRAWTAAIRSAPAHRARARLVLQLPENQLWSAQQLVRQHGLAESVALTSMDADLWAAAGSADVFVNHRLHESQVANARAMQLGLAVVSCRKEQELLVPGQTGEEILANDSETLRKVLMNFLHNPRKAGAQGRAARLRLVQHFGVDAMANRYAAVYQTLLRRHGGLPVMRSAHG